MKTKANAAVKVKTVNGTRINRTDAVFIKGKYYSRAFDCDMFDNIFIRKDSSRVYFDHSDQRAHLVNSQSSSLRDRALGIRLNTPSLMMGIVDYDKNSNTFIMGMFAPQVGITGTVWNKDRNMKLSLSPKNKIYQSLFKDICRDSVFTVMNEEIILKSKLKQTKHKEYLIPKESIDDLSLHTGGRYSVPKTYGATPLINAFNGQLKSRMKELNSLYPKSTVAPSLGKYTYGIEFETWDGRIPERELWKVGLMPLFDGSLRHTNDSTGKIGHEYATIPHSGEVGLKALRRSCELLSEYTTMNEKCSLHIHVGGIKRDEKTAMNLFKTLYLLQDEFYSLFPSALKNTGKYKERDYCSPIPNIKNFADLLDYSSDGVMGANDISNGNFKFGMPHPKDRDDTRKWNIGSRYAIFNFVPFIFTERGTIELRVSTPTCNYNKVAALLSLFIAVIKYAETTKIIPAKLTLANVICSLPKPLKDSLSAYIDHRKKTLSAFTLDKGVVKYTELIKDMSNDNILYNGKPILY